MNSSNASDVIKTDIGSALPIDTSLHDAVRDNDLDQVIALIIDQKIDVNIQDEFGCTALYVAVSSNNDAWFCDYSGGETESDDCDYSGDEDDHRSPIYKAKAINLPAWDIRMQIIDILLENGADPNLQNSHGETALHGALENDTDYTDYIYEMVYGLLEKDADPTIEDGSLNTPYELASSKFGPEDTLSRNIKKEMQRQFNALIEPFERSVLNMASPYTNEVEDLGVSAENLQRFVKKNPSFCKKELQFTCMDYLILKASHAKSGCQFTQDDLPIAKILLAIPKEELHEQVRTWIEKMLCEYSEVQENRETFSSSLDIRNMLVYTSFYINSSFKDFASNEPANPQTKSASNH